MRATKIGLSVAAVILGLTMTGYFLQAQSGAQNRGRDASSPAAYVVPALPESDRAYGAIDGKHLHEYVDEQVAISRRYRDQGHPQFWGRIIGTSGDTESAEWLLNKYKQIGLTETRIQPLDLLPQWMAQSWEVTAAGAGKALPLTSAQPAYHTPGTQGEGLELEAVYVGLGSEADFAGRDVRGKAVFVFGMMKPGPSAAQAGALKRAEEKGAAAIFSVEGLPGNMKYQSYPTNTNVPTFSLGTEDGEAVRNMIAQAMPGQAPHVRIRLDVQLVPNLKTALVWGTLPGATDETIYVIAHRDGWFDAAGDNAGGVAAMLGLAEYFAKVPKDQRRRTMVFIGTDGHHNTGPGVGAGREWLVAHRNQFFTKTAMMINCEHPSDVDTYPEMNTFAPLEWYAGGPSRPEMQEMAGSIFREFGVTTWAQPSKVPPGGDVGRFYWFVPGVVAQSNDFLYFHTDKNNAESVPWTGLEAVTRAYAKIVDQVNKIDLKDLQRPVGSDPRPPSSGTGQ